MQSKPKKQSLKSFVGEPSRKNLVAAAERLTAAGLEVSWSGVRKAITQKRDITITVDEDGSISAMERRPWPTAGCRTPA